MVKSHDSADVMNEVREALLSKNKIHVNSVFAGEKNISFKYANENVDVNYSLTKYQVSTLLRISLFHLLQYTEKNTLTDDNNYNCKIIIISLLYVANDLEPRNDITFLKECAKSIFKNPLVLQNFLPVYRKQDFTQTMFTDTFKEICKVFYSFNKECTSIVTIHSYKEKLITQLKAMVEIYKTKDKMKHCVKMEFLEILQFNVPELVDSLTAIMELPRIKFLSSERTDLSIWAVIVSKLIEACLEINSTYSKNIFPLDIRLFKKFCSYLVEIKSLKVDVFLWETSLYKYLQRFPHNIGDIDKGTFALLLQNPISEASLKLISLLISRKIDSIQQFTMIIRRNVCVMQEGSIIFPLLGSNLNYNWDKHFLAELYEIHKNEIISYFTKPTGKNSWIEENVEAIMYLIKTSFDPETCQQICKTILMNGDKLQKVNMQYVQVLESLFTKVNAFKEFTQVLIHLIVSTLKLCRSKASLSSNKKRLGFLCQTLISTIEVLKLKEDMIYEELSKNHCWPQFVRYLLSQGLKLAEEDNALDSTLLIRSLNAACSIAYQDNGCDEYVKTIFGLATSHSEYAAIMLSFSSIKRYLVELILTLIRKNAATMLPNHISLYLSAYNATLSETDQILLLIVKEYENSNLNLGKYRPFLWGSAAASHYSVKDDPNTALWRQPKTSQILDLFEPELVNDTVINFPIQRSIKDNTLCTPRNVYDPVFYLSILCEVLSVHNPVAYYKVTQSGALALMLMACCSNCDKIRMAAYTDLSRFYFHLENLDVQGSNQRLLWIRFIDFLRNGIVDLETPINEVYLNGFVATFLARASIVGTQPLHPLYVPLHNFFMAKSGIKLNTIPEFKNLFLSSELQYKAHRCWILKVVRDGFKSETDLQVARNCSVFNIILSFYTSSLSDKPTKKLILEIINSVGRIPKSGLLLVNYYGILSWLNAIIDCLESSDLDFVPLLIDIAKNFFDCFTKKTVPEKFPLFLLMHVLITLIPKMTSKNITIACFTTYANILEKMLIKDSLLTEKHMNDLLELSKKLIGSMKECEELLEYGCEFASKEIDDQFQEEVCFARRSFRKLILKWHNCKKS